MTVRVLQSKTEIYTARQELRRQGLSCVSRWQTSTLQRIVTKLGLFYYSQVGDVVKSWDILNTTQFIRLNVPLDAPILDIGAYASEILCVLHRLKYTTLTGIDLNPRIKFMPYAKAIRYEVGNFMNTPFPDASFTAITAISVIEHGLQSQRLLAEISRVLRPGGYFIASFDYWPVKIDTKGVEIFGMDWKIFSADEVSEFLDQANTYSLKPVGDVSLQARVPTMEWAGEYYTFAWLAVQKTAQSR
jgi:SAM-dependent methyltransferase